MGLSQLLGRALPFPIDHRLPFPKSTPMKVAPETYVEIFEYYFWNYLKNLK